MEGICEVEGPGVGVAVVGCGVGRNETVGILDGSKEMLGFSLGMLEIDGLAVGEDVAVLPHSIADVQRIQISVLDVMTIPSLTLLALNPLKQVHIGWKILPYLPVATA